MGIGTTAPDASAALDIVSSRKGALLPQLTNVQCGAIASSARGLLIFQTDAPAGFYYNAGTTTAPDWQQVATAAGAAVTATNGLTRTGGVFGLGGTLTGATTIAQSGNPFILAGGSVGIGTSIPLAGLHVDTPESASSTALGVIASGGTSGNPSLELRVNGKVPYIDFAETSGVGTTPPAFSAAAAP